MALFFLCVWKPKETQRNSKKPKETEWVRMKPKRTERNQDKAKEAPCWGGRLFADFWIIIIPFGEDNAIHRK